MGTSTEELSNDIARTRAELSQDVDALQDRVSPSAIMERRKYAVLTHLAVERPAPASTQNVALSAVLFLYSLDASLAQSDSCVACLLERAGAKLAPLLPDACSAADSRFGWLRRGSRRADLWPATSRR